MALVVQDDTGEVTDANGYISVDYFNEYHTDRGVDAVVDGEFDDEDIEAAIVAATDYIDHLYRYRGVRLLGPDQTTQFPRSGLYDNEGYLIEGLPVDIKKATAEYALRAIDAPLQPDPTTDPSGRAVVEVTKNVGPIQTTTKYGGSSVTQLKLPFPAADRLLTPFRASGNAVDR